MNPDKEPIPSYEELRDFVESLYEEQAKVIYNDLMNRLMAKS